VVHVKALVLRVRNTVISECEVHSSVAVPNPENVTILPWF